MKYWFIFMPSAFVLRCTHSGSISISLSLFCKNRISDVTSVPAADLNVLFGSLIAPSNSALCAIYFRTAGFSLSIVPLDVIKAMIPPGLTLSKVFAKK